MRIFKALVVVAILLFGLSLSMLPSIAVSAQEDPYLVGNGQFGAWKLGTPEADALNMFTERFGSGYQKGVMRNLRGAWFYFWAKTGFQFTALEGRVVGIFVWRRYGPGTEQANAELLKYRTPEDIRIGHALTALLAAYGPPDAQWQVRYSQTFTNTSMVWKKRGLYVEIHDGTVDALGVYELVGDWK